MPRKIKKKFVPVLSTIFENNKNLIQNIKRVINVNNYNFVNKKGRFEILSPARYDAPYKKGRFEVKERLSPEPKFVGKKGRFEIFER